MTPQPMFGDQADGLPPTEAERVAIEHVRQRRREGWRLAECWSEACQCLRLLGFPTPRMGCSGWDDVTRAYATAWEWLPKDRRAGWMQDEGAAA